MKADPNLRENMPKKQRKKLFVRLHSIVNKFEGLFGYENKHIEKKFDG